MLRYRFFSAVSLLSGLLGTGCLEVLNASALVDATLTTESTTTGGETTTESTTTSSTTTDGETTSSTPEETTTSSTTTESTGCSPTTPVFCYDGPPGTLGVGLCHGGARACLEDGSLAAQCDGEVLPVAECGINDVDESCDGHSVAHLWSQKVGGFDIERIIGSAVLADGSAVFTGYSWGPMSVGDKVVDPGAFVFAMDGLGAVLWAKSFGEPEGAVGISVALDLQRDVILTGFAKTPIDFGGGVLSPPQQMDVIAKLSGANGEHLWSRFLGGGVDLTVDSIVAVDASGSSVVAGQYEGTLAWPEGDIPAGPVAERHLFLSFLDPSGTHVKSLDCGPHAMPKQIRIADNGDILLLGVTYGVADLGGGPLLPPGNFLARYAPDGTLLWSRLIGSETVSSFGRGLGIEPDGTIVVAVPFKGILELGETPVEALTVDIAVAALAPGGDVLWSRVFGGAGVDAPFGLAITSDDHIVIGGTFEQTLDVGLCPVESPLGQNAFLLDLDASGNPTWMQSFGGESGDSDDYGSSWPSEIITAVGAVADGSVVLAGEMDGVVSWGGATFAAAAPGDLVIARYSR